MAAIPHIVGNILSRLPVLVCHGFCPNIFLVSRCIGHFNNKILFFSNFVIMYYGKISCYWSILPSNCWVDFFVFLFNVV